MYIFNLCDPGVFFRGGSACVLEQTPSLEGWTQQCPGLLVKKSKHTVIQLVVPQYINSMFER